MNSSIIINDIRKRSIRVERDQILAQLKREEEIESMSIPKRFILEVEERAREKVDSQGWKKMMFLTVIVLVGGFLLVKLLRRINKETPYPAPVREAMDMEIQTDEIPSKKTVRFEDDTEENSLETVKFTKLMGEFPDSWRNFFRNHGPDNLISDITGRLLFDYYDEENRVAVDLEPGDFFQFPNSLTNDEIRFQNMIYDKKIKRSYCEEGGIDYYEFTL